VNGWDTYCGVKLDSGGNCSRSHWTQGQLVEHLEIEHGMSVTEAKAYLDDRK
jgi:hypothetical protein